MFPGPYSICHGFFGDNNSDACSFRTLKFGYDTASNAYSDIEDIAKEEKVEVNECVVIRIIEKDEASGFSG